MRVAMKQTMGNFFPFGIEEVSRQNMAMMERAMSLFSPLYRPGSPEAVEQAAAQAAAQGAAAPPAPSVRPEDLDALHAEIASLRRQLETAQTAMTQVAMTQAVASQPVAPPPATVEKLPVKPVAIELPASSATSPTNVEKLPSKSEPMAKKPATGG
jgi:hypothetical protein